METRSGATIPFVEEVKEPRVAKPPKVETRSAAVVPLTGDPLLAELTGSRLPTKNEVFCHFFYLLKIEKMTAQNAKRAAVKAASTFWELVAITPKRIDNGIAMLTAMHDDYQACCMIHLLSVTSLLSFLSFLSFLTFLSDKTMQ